MTTHRATGLERIIGASIVAPFTIEVVFDDGMKRRIDLSDQLSGPFFEPLNDAAYFAQMRLDPDLGTVVWPNGADLAPEFLSEAGEQVRA